ncbi:uncharacterized protein DUF5117 [Rhodothalassium salexigens DSM 2132]|uniref:Uncharacterized protein DUF5117 n=1 Tax=Rhodothalassium salexigens DSM 2132 TaxID=1188247 RepID=A0A4R2PPJ1_RHOSA|nr:zinc-dependent metalloprotease [Rhodothalassium salexigens]MBB4210774.1 hypothetical protein [Rhodothalassium salexigens DSM 2132]TCP37670.1 uncharacterized protein DUF5117 [Rhodothalassium salexigens DSM 2132]
MASPVPRLIAWLLTSAIVFAPAPQAIGRDAPGPAQPAAQETDAQDTDDAADDAADDGEDKDADTDAEEDKTLEQIVDGHTVHEGLFTLYRDPEDGTVRMAIAKDQLGGRFVYFTHTVDGVLEAGHFRGAFRDNTIFAINRHFDCIEFVEENTHFYFDPDNALSRAASANISPAVLAAAEIEAESEDGETLLIKADGLFLKEAFHQVAPTPNPKAPPGSQFKVGKLADDRTKIRRIATYPENIAVTVDYVYTNPQPLVGGSEAVTDPRAVQVTLQHSLIALPETDYEPRFDDPRVGYFFDRVTDLTSHSATPYRDMITRWDLRKKTPGAKLSEPVEPIVWWIENTTPDAYRDAIRAGVEAWNEAFEAAGFKNAMVVKVQPDDADWDAGDIRYNVLRWTSSPQPPFGGYGPSFTNPLTGQILGADIMLENVYVTNRLVYDDLFDVAGRGLAPQPLPLPGAPATAGDAPGKAMMCSMGHHLQVNTLFAKSVLDARGYSDAEKERLVQEGLRLLTLHEVGHTLGLNHNMMATHAVSYDGIYDRDITQGTISGSVMDYQALNVSPDPDDQPNYFDTRPGPYDVWAIRFAYDPDLADAEARAAHLARSTEPALVFGNDADDMRAPGRGNDPRVMIGDLSDDPIQYARDRVKLVRDTLSEAKARFDDPGQSWHALRNAYLILTGQHNTAMRVVSRYIGGIYQNRAFTDQASDRPPFAPVPGDTQREAMAVLAEHLFAPEAFETPEDLLNHLQKQRRGFDHFFEPYDPTLHQRYLSIQAEILAHLTHPNTLRRVTDSRLYGNNYGAAEMMGDLTDAVFEADLRGDVSTIRQNLQIEYTRRLTEILDDTEAYDHVARSAALAAIKQIEDWMDSARRGNAETRAHRTHVTLLLERALYPRQDL